MSQRKERSSTTLAKHCASSAPKRLITRATTALACFPSGKNKSLKVFIVIFTSFSFVLLVFAY
jgi:hypothetical protein